MMAARLQIEGVEAPRKAPTPNIACLIGAAISQYPVVGLGSTEYAAGVIAARCHLSPAVARKVVELVGIGGDA
jgi:hypothetical protein